MTVRGRRKVRVPFGLGFETVAAGLQQRRGGAKQRRVITIAGRATG